MTPELTIEDLKKPKNPLEAFEESLSSLKLEELLILLSVITNKCLTVRNLELQNKQRLLKPKKNLIHA